jgi:hypothetical protein
VPELWDFEVKQPDQGISRSSLITGSGLARHCLITVVLIF